MQGKPNDYRAMLKVGYYHQNDRGRESAIRPFDTEPAGSVLSCVGLSVSINCNRPALIYSARSSAHQVPWHQVPSRPSSATYPHGSRYR